MDYQKHVVARVIKNYLSMGIPNIYFQEKEKRKGLIFNF